MTRVEVWHKDGQTVHVEIDDLEVVHVSAQIIASMLRELGWERTNG